MNQPRVIYGLASRSQNFFADVPRYSLKHLLKYDLEESLLALFLMDILEDDQPADDQPADDQPVDDNTIGYLTSISDTLEITSADYTVNMSRGHSLGHRVQLREIAVCAG
jgi:hypothetical protein